MARIPSRKITKVRTSKKAPVNASTMLSLRDGIKDLARTYLWEVTIPNLPGYNKDVKILAESTSMPAKNINVVDANFRRSKIRVAAGIAWGGSWDVVFKELSDFKIHKAFVAWSNLACHSVMNLEMPQLVYKRAVILRLLDVKLKEVYKITLDGCFPEVINDTNLDYTTSDKINISCTLSYDLWY